jgi:radical SAM enzyme (TIGR01210 family)
VFLAGAECPFTCVFCDLWRHTLDGPTPPGAIPAQLDLAAAEIAARTGGRPPRALKLYNASNFFDERAVPPADDPAIAERAAVAARVVVECHPKLITARAGAARCLALAAALAERGARLEVAMGLETIHPEALPKLGKGMRSADFERAAALLTGAGVAVRAFVLVGAPFVPAEEAAHWAAESAAWAFDRGVSFVALIPVRPGNGTLERLAAAGAFRPPAAADLEAALAGALAAAERHAAAGRPRPVAIADPWDLDRLAGADDPLRARLAAMNRDQRPVSRERALPDGPDPDTDPRSGAGVPAAARLETRP